MSVNVSLKRIDKDGFTAEIVVQGHFLKNEDCARVTGAIDVLSYVAPCSPHRETGLSVLLLKLTKKQYEGVYKYLAELNKLYPKTMRKELEDW